MQGVVFQLSCSALLGIIEFCMWAVQSFPCVQCKVCTLQCAVCSVQCAVCSVQCSVQCAVCSVQCAVQCARLRLLYKHWARTGYHQLSRDGGEESTSR